MKDRKYIIECSCGNPSHLCIFHYYKDKDSAFNSIDIYFTSNYHLGFFERLKLGLKFILFRRDYNMSDTIMLNSDELYKLEQVIKEYKEDVLSKDYNPKLDFFV